MKSIENQILDAGFGNPQIVFDGEIHRFVPPYTKNNTGWLVASEISGTQIVTVGCWKQNRKETFCNKAAKQFTPLQRQQYSEAMARARQQAKQKKLVLQVEAKLVVNQLWSNSSDNGVKSHQYLLKKQIAALNVRIDQNNNLLIPMYDRFDELWNIQSITPNGLKLFSKGAKVKHCFHPIGILDTHPAQIILCEGFATGMSIYQATQIPTVVCFNASNLGSSAIIMRHKYPHSRLIIAGDNDQFNKINIGILKASFAAEYVQGRMVLPRFKDLSSKPTDFNDLHCLEGLDTVSHQIMEGCCEL